jgi:hypothetical protein
MRISPTVALLVALLCCAGSAEAESRSCPAAGDIVRTAVDASAAVAGISSRCRPGDTISIPSEWTGVTGSLCDLSKRMQTVQTSTGPETICVMVEAGKLR